MKFEISSDTIGLITEALSKAQGSIENALKDSANPFFKSKYADLSSVMAVTKTPLSENKLSFSSSVVQIDKVNFLICTLSHVSGEWFRSYMPLIISKNDMQALGAAISYGRRFCLSALCHVGVEENDAEGTIDRSTGEVKPSRHHDIQVPHLPLSDKQKAEIECLVQAIDDKDWIDATKAKAKVNDFADISAERFSGLIKALSAKVSE
jgi:hypothetical protein